MYTHMNPTFGWALSMRFSLCTLFFFLSVFLSPYRCLPSQTPTPPVARLLISSCQGHTGPWLARVNTLHNVLSHPRYGLYAILKLSTWFFFLSLAKFFNSFNCSFIRSTTLLEYFVVRWGRSCKRWSRTVS